jgi:hypothetical protein
MQQKLQQKNHVSKTLTKNIEAYKSLVWECKRNCAVGHVLSVKLQEKLCGWTCIMLCDSINESILLEILQKIQIYSSIDMWL